MIEFMLAVGAVVGTLGAIVLLIVAVDRGWFSK